MTDTVTDLTTLTRDALWNLANTGNRAAQAEWDRRQIGAVMSVETTGDALGRLEQSLKATNVLSKDYTGHVLGWAYKVAELADKSAREKAKAGFAERLQGLREASEKAQAERDGADGYHVLMDAVMDLLDAHGKSS